MRVRDSDDVGRCHGRWPRVGNACSVRRMPELTAVCWPSLRVTEGEAPNIQLRRSAPNR